MEPLSGWERIQAIPFPELTHEQLVAICDRHGLPRGPFGRLPETGVINAISTVADIAVVRIPKDEPSCLYDTWRESVAVPAATAAGVRTPAMLAFDDSLDVVPVPFGIFEWVHLPHGWPSTVAGWRDLGRQLAIVHAATPEDPERRLSDADRWHRCDEVVGTGGLAPGLRAAFEAEVARLEQILAEGWPRRFVHDDIQDSNLLFDERADEVWLIDWGDAGWGDATLDLRRLPPGVTPLVLEGYREVTTTDDGFEARVRWDQLHTTLRRVQEPELRRRLEAMLTG